jgi:glycerophosphoryl diester phosphodiesterase
MRPQVVAHRGASATVGEHTLAADVEALAVGADGLECDVRLTADGHLVCVHDRDLKRTTGTRGLVSAMELADLAELDFAKWKNPWNDLDDEAPVRDERLDRVLTLRTLLETVRDFTSSTGRRVELAIETKHPTRYGGLVEKKLVELLREFGWDGADSPVRVMSFSFTALQRIERLAPDLPIVQLVERARTWSLLRSVVGRDWIIGPGIKELREHPNWGRRIRATGREVHVWTVNKQADLDLCLDIGVSAVITDKPAVMQGWLDARGLESS